MYIYENIDIPTFGQRNSVPHTYPENISLKFSTLHLEKYIREVAWLIWLGLKRERERKYRSSKALERPNLECKKGTEPPYGGRSRRRSSNDDL